MRETRARAPATSPSAAKKLFSERSVTRRAELAVQNQQRLPGAAPAELDADVRCLHKCLSKGACYWCGHSITPYSRLHDLLPIRKYCMTLTPPSAT